MSAIYKNGIAYGGAASAANLISAMDAEGAATNVQAELDNINENISTLNNDLTNNLQIKIIKIERTNQSDKIFTFHVPTGSHHFIIVMSGYLQQQWVGTVFASAVNSSVTPKEILKGSQVNNITGAANQISFTMNNTTNLRLIDFIIDGDAIS